MRPLESIVTVFKRRKTDSDLNDELRFHLEKEAELNVARGMSADEARRRALIAFGGVEQARENVRRVRWSYWAETLTQDLRYSARMLRKSPIFTAVVVGVLAIGIGANTAIFSVINAVLLKMLPVKEPEKLVFLGFIDNRGRLQTNFPYPFFDEIRDRNRAFSDIFAARAIEKLDIKLKGAENAGEREQASIEEVSGSYFSILGVNAVLGRSLTPDDDKIGVPNPVAVISYGYWKRRLGLDPSVVGKTFAAGDTVFTIVGVAPPGFFGETVGRMPDMWVPLTFEDRLRGESLLNSANMYWLEIIGRLRPGVSPQQAMASMDVLLQQVTGELQGPKAGSARTKTQIGPASKGLDELRQGFAQPIEVLMWVVGLVLLIACVSVASLLMARATARQREIALRVTLGASRRRLVQQLLTESVMLAFIGGVLGLALAWGAGDLLPILLFQGNLSLELVMNTQVLGFTLLISIFTGIIFGLAPASGVLRPDLACRLKDEHAGIHDRGRRFGLRKILIVAQVALSLLLLVAAGLFVRSLQKLYDVDIGFNKENLLLVRLQPGPDLNVDRLRNVYQDVLDKVSALPGVKSCSVSLGSFADGGRMTTGPWAVEGYTPKPGENATLPSDTTSPGFFKTMGIPVVLGRDFRPQDDRNAPRVAIVNQTFARYYFDNANPVGKHFAWSRLDRRPMEIIGVVQDAKYSSLKEQTPPFYYTPFMQPDEIASDVRLLEVRTAANPAAVSAAVRSAVDSIEAGLRVDNITTMAVQVEDSLQQEKMLAKVSGSFGVFALLLACIGLYGVMSHLVTSRTNEIGVRMALGADRFDVLWMILREALLLVAAGIALGIPAALAGTRLASSLISGLLFGLKAYDPVTIAVAALLMTVVALLAGYLPARRAANVDPIVAIRYE
jgi:predicted permease